MQDLTQELPVSNTVDYNYAYRPSYNLQTLSTAGSVARLRTKIAPLRFTLAAKEIVKELMLKPTDKVLEVGSGIGLLGNAIKKQVGGNLEYYGVELAYNPAIESKNTITPVQSNAVHTPFASSSFDSVVSTDVLEHIPNARQAVEEIKRVLKPGGKAFIVIADPSEGRFQNVSDHIDRTGEGSNIEFWQNIFKQKGFTLLSKNSAKYRKKDWRRIFNLPFLVKLKDKPGFACAFNPVNRPGTYILRKPEATPLPK